MRVHDFQLQTVLLDMTVGGTSTFLKLMGPHPRASIGDME